MSRLWRTDGRRTNRGKWKIEQCSVGPETAILHTSYGWRALTIGNRWTFYLFLWFVEQNCIAIGHALYESAENISKKMNSILTIFCILLLLAPASKMMHWEFGCNGRRIFSKRTLHSRIYVAIDGDDGDDEYFGKVNEINVWKQSLCVANFCAFASWS